MENFAAVPTPRATEKSIFVTYLKHSLMAELQTQGFDIDLSEEIAQGNYSNLAIIAHSTSEFIIDFAAMLPGLKKAKVKSRVILTPDNAPAARGRGSRARPRHEVGKGLTPLKRGRRAAFDILSML